MVESEDARSNRAAPVVEVEFTMRTTDYPFTGVSAAEECSLELARIIRRSEEKYAEFFNVSDADPAKIEALAAQHETAEVTLLREYEEGGLVEFVVSGNCPAHDLAERGALPRTVEGVDGEGRIVAEIPPDRDAAALVEAFLDAHPAAELESKRTKDAHTPMLTSGTLGETLLAHLTDRQWEVLQAAFEAGYYEWPRECTGEEVAAELGIASTTFSEHIHAAERNLLTAMFEHSR